MTPIIHYDEATGMYVNLYGINHGAVQLTKHHPHKTHLMPHDTIFKVIRPGTARYGSGNPINLIWHMTTFRVKRCKGDAGKSDYNMYVHMSSTPLGDADIARCQAILDRQSGATNG